METFTLGCFDCDLNEEEVRFLNMPAAQYNVGKKEYSSNLV